MIFGIHDAELKRQVNFLIDEAVKTGKGANVVASMLHHYIRMEIPELEDLILNLIADNCAGAKRLIM